MSGISSEAEELRQQIETAFAEVEYPGDDRLVYDTSGDHLECNEVAAAFRGKHWKEIPLDTLRYHSSGIFFLTPEAYRFYLPAYLIAGSLHYDQADLIPDSVVSSITPPSDERNFDVYQRRMEGLTPPQRKALRSFLQFLKLHHAEDDPLGDLDKALASVKGSVLDFDQSRRCA
jgi:hypothetical protein